MLRLDRLGQNLRKARKRHYPGDDMKAFAIRLGISRATLQKMESGELSVSMVYYYKAADLLGLTEGFSLLFEEQGSLFDDE
ncbi:MAG: helix-turn-helix domain-containing protein [Agarilytica sp.]